MSRFNALLLLFIATASWPALSAERPPCTSTPTCWPPVEIPYRHADEMPLEIDPVTGLATSSVVRPLRDAPVAGRPALAPVPGLPAAPGAAKPPPVLGRPHVALILPIASPSLGALAEAVRVGFTAAASIEGPEAPPVIVTAVENEGMALLDACRQAQAAGAFLVVGGLTRDGAQSLARSDCVRQPVLALNEPFGGKPGAEVTEANLPANLYHVSLSVEHEARQVALLAVNEGWRSAIVITHVSPLARRVQDAFEREWSRAGGEVRRLTYSGNPDEAAMIRARIATLRADMVFLALGPDDLRAVRPYVSGTLPVYSTTFGVNPRAEPVVNVDLQGVRYMEMPWFVQPDHVAVMAYPPQSNMSVDQERLYAFGIDSFRITLAILKGDAGRIALDGVTGRIGMDSTVRAFVRTLVPAEVDGGRVIPHRTAAAPQ
jgi:outer membrane PBP1 activator LpoA protein